MKTLRWLLCWLLVAVPAFAQTSLPSSGANFVNATSPLVINALNVGTGALGIAPATSTSVILDGYTLTFPSANANLPYFTATPTSGQCASWSGTSGLLTSVACGSGGGGVTSLGGATGAISLGTNLSISGSTLNATGGGSSVTFGGSTVSSLVAGTNVSMTLASGALTIAATGGSSGVTFGGTNYSTLAAGSGVSITPSGSTLTFSSSGSSSGLSPTACPAAVGGVITLPFASSGNIWYACTISANTTFAISGGTTTSLQEIRMEIIENSTGGFSVTLPSSSSSPAVLWPGGVQPTPVSTANSINIFKVSTTTVSGKLIGSY